MSIAKIHTSYNKLPSIEAAHATFVARNILSQLFDVFVNHQEFGISLVHRHTTLEYGEVMVHSGDITQPERIHHDADAITGAALVVDTGGTGSDRLKRVYPHSWLITGQPYEYTLHPTPALPPQLIQRFHAEVKKTNVDGGQDLLGICHVPGGVKADEMFIERTEGRKNIEQRVHLDDEVKPGNSIPTRWHPALSPSGTPARCTCECVLIGGLHIGTC